MYILEKYKKHNRYNDQYDEVYNYLLTCCDKGYNEHFHWARYEWMIGHPMLEAEYEALNRAGKLGAKRAIVLSGQEFYYSLGFQDSSEFALWGK